MADKPLIAPSELKNNKLEESFKDKPHSIYVVYDNLMDELIFKLVKPDHLVSAYFITDDFALLIDPENYEVVGYQFIDFTKAHLKKFNCTSKLWTKERLEERFSNYVELKWEPSEEQENSENNNDNSYLFYKQNKIDKALATC